MYNFSFICRASKIDKKGFAPIEPSIIINGTRTYVILPMKYEPSLFNKMMASKRNNEVLEYTSSIRDQRKKKNERLSLFVSIFFERHLSKIGLVRFGYIANGVN